MVKPKDGQGIQIYIPWLWWEELKYYTVKSMETGNWVPQFEYEMGPQAHECLYLSLKALEALK